MANIRQAMFSGHSDLVHDISYDYYGDRMATCSSDHTVKVWEKENDEWVKNVSWKAHTAPVCRVTWSHPEFGNVLATCSYDRTAAIWEELVCVGGHGDSLNQNKSWVRKHIFVDSKTCVSDVKFAPKHIGLQLATCSTDGAVRIYEAPDVMNLSQWTLQLEINIKSSASSLSWCTSIHLNPIIAVGSDDASSGVGPKVFIYELSDEMRKATRIDVISSITDPVQDVAFAPNMGRSFNLLAIASKDVSIIQLKAVGKDQASSLQTKFEQRMVAQFSDHKSIVWRLCWNVTGTTLASTGDDGFIRLWKSNYLGNWSCYLLLKGDGSLIENKEPKKSVAALAANNQTSQSNSNEVQRRAQTKRNSGWPYFHTEKDQGNAYY